MIAENTVCPCACHEGKRVTHWQLGQTMGYEPSPCACAIKGNPNYVPDKIRATWEK